MSAARGFLQDAPPPQVTCAPRARAAGPAPSAELEGGSSGAGAVRPAQPWERRVPVT